MWYDVKVEQEVGQLLITVKIFFSGPFSSLSPLRNVSLLWTREPLRSEHIVYSAVWSV